MFSLVYYDLVLIAIALSMGVGIGIGFVTAVSMTLAVPLVSLVAIAIVAHALFVNGPVDDTDDLTKAVEPEEVPGVATVAKVVD